MYQEGADFIKLIDYIFAQGEGPFEITLSSAGHHTTVTAASIREAHSLIALVTYISTSRDFMFEADGRKLNVFL